MARIGIRHEDKSVWEARAPLTPEAVGALIAERGVSFTVQTSPTRHYMELRLNLARTLLSQTSQPVTDIALRCGFKEASPEVRVACIHIDLLAGFGVFDHDQTRIGHFHFTGIPQAHADQFVAAVQK